MNPLIKKIVSTNAGWLARNILKVSTLISIAIAAFLAGKGFHNDISTVIAAGAGGAFMWTVETTLSFIARKYSVEDTINPVVDAIRRVSAKLIIFLLICPWLVSCQGGKFLGLDKKQWGSVAMETGKEAVPIAISAYNKSKITASPKQPVEGVLPDTAPTSSTGVLDLIIGLFTK